VEYALRLCRGGELGAVNKGRSEKQMSALMQIIRREITARHSVLKARRCAPEGSLHGLYESGALWGGGQPLPVDQSGGRWAAASQGCSGDNPSHAHASVMV
jgi:hypothetical protein